MSDWEEFCEANDWNPSSEEDYDGFLDSLESGGEDCQNAYVENDSLHFDTYKNAAKWAAANPGRTIRRAANGIGFEVKSLSPFNNLSSSQSAVERSNEIFPDHNDEIWDFQKRHEQIAQFSPQLKNVLAKSSTNHGRVYMQPFHRTKWEQELRRLSRHHLKQLRLLISVNLEDNRNTARKMESEINRRRNAKRRNSSDFLALYAAIQDFMETVLSDIDRFLVNE